MGEILKEIADTLELHARAIMELQARVLGKDAKLTLEITESIRKNVFDDLRKKIDALPKE